MIDSSASIIKNIRNKISSSSWRAIGIISSLALLTVFWFGTFPYKTFMGDDLQLIIGAQNGGYASSFINALTDGASNKYRPVFASFFHIESTVFGSDFRSYMNFNIFLEFLNACLVSFISWRLSHKQLFVAFTSGVLFIVSRFSYYNVLQVFGGPLEGLALFLFLMLIITTLYAYEVKKPLSLVLPLLFYFLLIFTHERYVVVGGFLVAAILMAPINFRRYYHRLILAVIPLIILIINYAIKTFVFKARFFEGTGGHSITFDYHQFLFLLYAGFVNMFGFNVGPNYLTGLDLSGAGFFGIAIGSILTLSYISLIITYVYSNLCSPQKKHVLCNGKNTFLFLTLFFSLLAAASVTIRQEYRWLYAPYAVVIFGIAYMSGRISSPKWLRSLIIIFILISAISVDTYYRSYLNNVYFIDGLRVADSAKTNIIDVYGTNLSQNEVFFISAYSTVKTWYFFDNKFFRFYTGDPDISVHYVDNFEDIKNYRKEINKVLVFYFDHIKREVIDITPEARASLAKHSDFLDITSYDFLANFSTGRISSTQKVSTPTGYGVFVMALPGQLGVEKTLTIITGFNYTYNNVSIRQNDSLSFSAGIPYENSDGALAYIDVTTEYGKRKRIFKADIFSATEKGIRWESFLIPLKDYAEQEVDFTFGVESPSGDPSADWINFGSPRLLSHK